MNYWKINLLKSQAITGQLLGEVCRCHLLWQSWILLMLQTKPVFDISASSANWHGISQQSHPTSNNCGTEEHVYKNLRSRSIPISSFSSKDDMNCQCSTYQDESVGDEHYLRITDILPRSYARRCHHFMATISIATAKPLSIWHAKIKDLCG